MIKYNLKLFEIKEKPERHQHFLVFLIRKFYPKNFDGTFTRSDFIKIGMEKFGYNKNTIKGIFDKGIKENKFILKDYKKRGKKYYVLKSNTYKEEHNIKDLNLGKHFLDEKGKIMYDKLYDENYQKIIEKVISQY